MSRLLWCLRFEANESATQPLALALQTLHPEDEQRLLLPFEIRPSLFLPLKHLALF